MRFTKTVAVVAALMLPACGDDETTDTGTSADTGATATTPTTPTGTTPTGTGTTQTGATGTGTTAPTGS